jgi:hypothetical protein
VPAARAAALVYDGDVLDHMQAAAKVTLPAADLAGVVVTASTDLPVGAGWMDFLACASGGVNQISAGSQPDYREAGQSRRQHRHARLDDIQRLPQGETRRAP